MRPSMFQAGASLALLLCMGTAAAEETAHATASPDQQLAPLFQQVQRAHLFADQKTFADAVPRQLAAAALADWSAAQRQPGYTLRDFVATRFTVPVDAAAYAPPAGAILRAHT